MWHFNERTKAANLPVESAADIKHLELRKQWMEAKENLQNIITQVIIKQRVASLYPNSIEGELAEKAYCKAQSAMVKAINKYNNIHSILYTFIKEHSQELVTTADEQMLWAQNLDGMSIVEQQYRSFCRGY